MSRRFFGWTALSAIVVATVAVVWAAPARLRAPQAGRAVAILIDDQNMSTTDVDRAIALLGRVRAQVRPTDLLSVASTGSSSVFATLSPGAAGVRRFDQAVAKLREFVPRPPTFAPRPVRPLVDMQAGLVEAHDLLTEMTRAQSDPRILIFVPGEYDFDAFEIIRRRHLAREPLPEAASTWTVAPADLSENIVLGELRALLTEASEEHATFLTADANGFASWLPDGTAARVGDLNLGGS
jgi:hypothetical protein